MRSVRVHGGGRFKFGAYASTVTTSAIFPAYQCIFGTGTYQHTIGERAVKKLGSLGISGNLRIQCGYCFEFIAAKVDYHIAPRVSVT
jgi:hypothetical protein